MRPSASHRPKPIPTSFVVTALILAGGCTSGAGQVSGVVVVDQTTQALAAGDLSSVNGSYGDGCTDRTGDWSLAVASGATLAHPALSVVVHDTTCTLTITSLVTDVTYTAEAALGLTAEYAEQAAAFSADEGPIAFYANAKLDATTFADDFVLTLALSADPSLGAGDVTATIDVLGQAGVYRVLAGSTVTSTGLTWIDGQLGLSPGVSVTGFGPGVVTGTIEINNPAAAGAQADLAAAFTALDEMPCGFPATNPELGGVTLTPGVYCFSAAAVTLAGTLTLDFQGHADALFVFQIDTTLTTGANAAVVKINGGSDCNIYWKIGSSATIGANGSLAGNLLAWNSITVTTGAALSGRLLAHLAAVTLDTNVISAGCL